MTSVSSVRVTVHTLSRAQFAPSQPAKTESLAGMATSVTVPLGNVAEHCCPQEMPAALLITLPLPSPAGLTVSRGSGVGVFSKLAVTVRLSRGVTVHGRVPLQGEPHPVKREPAAATASRMTCLPFWKLMAHRRPHTIPAGVLVTVPAPVPVRRTVACSSPASTRRRERASTVTSAPCTVNLQGPVPVHGPPHPRKVAWGPGRATSTTRVPGVACVVHTAPQ